MRAGGIGACSHTPFGSLGAGLDLYEHQGKELFRQAGSGLGGAGRHDPRRGARGRRGARRPGRRQAQVLTGGRGKAGGIKLAADPDEAEARADAILGSTSGATSFASSGSSRPPTSRRSTTSRSRSTAVRNGRSTCSRCGGMDIEEVASESPEALVRLHVDPLEGFRPWQARRLVYAVGVDRPSEQKQAAGIVERLYEAFVASTPCSAEIIPSDRHARRRGEGARSRSSPSTRCAVPPSRDRRRCGTSRPTTCSSPSRARSTGCT